MMPKQIVYIIRHGKTDANLKRIYCGIKDLPLSIQGQVELAGKKFPTCEAFFTSTLQRTQQTLNIIYPNAKFETVADLQEFNFGQFELKSHEDLKDNLQYNEWIEDKTQTYSCPDGESREIFTKRILRGFDYVMQQTKGLSNVAIVTHGGVIANLMEAFFP